MAGGKGKITPQDGEKTRFSSERQPEVRGRKPNVRAWKDVLADMMPEEGWLQFKDVQEVDADGKPTGNVFRAARVKMATQEMIVMAAIKQAMKGNMAAIEKIWDRMDGKAVQPIEGKHEIKNSYSDLTEDEIKERLERIGNRP